MVRSWMEDDVDALHMIMSDSRVHTYTKDKEQPWNRARTEEYIRFMINKAFRTLDCFHGAAVEKSTNQLIGLCGLNPYLDGEPEIEFKLGVAYWEKGYATELGRAILCGAFETTEIKGIYGMAKLENTASRRVLEKIGMTFLGTGTFRGHEDAFYYIGKSND